MSEAGGANTVPPAFSYSRAVVVLAVLFRRRMIARLTAG
jgi:hypothetical protein